MTSEVKDGKGESKIEASSKEELEEVRQEKDRSAGQTKEGEQDITFFKFTTTTEGPRRRSGFEYDTVSDVVECKVHQCQQNSDA